MIFAMIILCLSWTAIFFVFGLIVGIDHMHKRMEQGEFYQDDLIYKHGRLAKPGNLTYRQVRKIVARAQKLDEKLEQERRAK